MKTLRVLSSLVVALQLTACQAQQRVSDARGADVHSFDGSRIVYDAVGEGEPALVFIHGWCCNRGQWENQVGEIAKNHRVVAIDLAGHGESGDTRTEWTLENFARDVEAVIEEEELDDVILVGHSMGGPVSLMAAATMPVRVIGVIGVDTLHNAEFKFPEEMVEQFATGFKNDFDTTMNGFFDFLYAELPDADPQVVERLRQDALDNKPHMAAALMRAFGYFDSRKAFRECPVTIHVINAAKPNPTMVEINRKYNPRFHAVFIENVGHWPQLEKPAEFNKLLREQVDSITQESAGAR